MKNLKIEPEGKTPPGFFVGYPEQELYVEMEECKLDKIEEYVNG